MFTKFHSRDIIAIIIVIGGFYLLVKGVDHIVAACLLSVVAFYYGLHIKKPID